MIICNRWLIVYSSWWRCLLPSQGESHIRALKMPPTVLSHVTDGVLKRAQHCKTPKAHSTCQCLYARLGSSLSKTRLHPARRFVRRPKRRSQGGPAAKGQPAGLPPAGPAAAPPGCSLTRQRQQLQVAQQPLRVAQAAAAQWASAPDTATHHQERSKHLVYATAVHRET